MQVGQSLRQRRGGAFEKVTVIKVLPNGLKRLSLYTSVLLSHWCKLPWDSNICNQCLKLGQTPKKLTAGGSLLVSPLRGRLQILSWSWVLGGISISFHHLCYLDPLFHVCLWSKFFRISLSIYCWWRPNRRMLGR